MRDLLYGADLLIVLAAQTFPFRQLADVVRDVPVIVVSGPHPSTAYLEWIGPFDRIVVSEDGDVDQDLPSEIEADEPVKLVWRLLRDSGDICDARRAKTVHRVNSGAVRSVFSGFSQETGVRPELVELRSGDAPSLLSSGEGEYEMQVIGVESLSSGTFSGESFDAAICAGSLQSIGTDERVNVIAGMWRVVRPGGRIIVVDEFVFDRETRDRLSLPPASISSYVEDVLSATSGQITLDFMQSLKYPPDEMRRAAVFSFRKL